MIIAKFGGTSVADSSCISSVLDIIQNNPEQQVVVVSALGGITNMIQESAQSAANGDLKYQGILSKIEERHFTCIKELIPIKAQSQVLSHIKQQINALSTLHEGVYLLRELSPRTKDHMLGFGELLSYYIIAKTAIARNLDVGFENARHLIFTKNDIEKNRVDPQKTFESIRSYFKKPKHRVTIVPGFVASDEEGAPTTLGRGGSDLTAALIASALGAKQLEIWTDVSGMFTAHPKYVKQARAIKQLSYQEAMELSHFGAKVIYPPTLQPVTKKNIPVIVKNTFYPEDEGTLITNENTSKGQAVRGISYIENIALLTLEGSGMIGIPGYSKKLLSVLAKEKINVIMMTQASSEHSICIGIESSMAALAKKIIEDDFAYEIESQRINPISVEDELSIIALVGENMKSHQGISGKMFSALGRNNVNVKAIAQGASERNITAVIDSSNTKQALNILHEVFFEKHIKQINLFITGVGNVGSKLIEQLHNQSEYLKSQLKLSVKVTGLSNSRKMLTDAEGIDLSNWEDQLAKGEKADSDAFFQIAKGLHLRNSIYVDNTANEKIAHTYPPYLKSSISVVTCNKIAAAETYAYYSNLKQLARTYNAPYLFETNVGAGLPIIDTLNHLITSGDKVNTIQAILSGSLNFVLNEFNEKTTFRQVVQQAMDAGFTEPDPKIDLSGVDVARKILILARESGLEMELSDIENESFLPKACLETKDNDSFLSSLDDHNDHFEKLFKSAASKNCRLKYVAELVDNKAKVGLKEIPVGHDFYNLSGSDNIVLFYTDRYKDQPLIVKGAGAGGEVTASGIFADIIRIAKQ
jgi:bifunctional aspartokinase / homoserine dehydrogenase 1